jgi:glycosyltransferase involved in cell wall biosynthesis
MDKVLFILHRTPPVHGAAKVGDYIFNNKNINKLFKCKFITIQSSSSISEIGLVNFKKIYSFLKLFINVLFSILIHRPDKIYFTPSIGGVAFFRDFLLSILWRIFGLFWHIHVYYHYHTKGIDKYIHKAKINKLLTSFFLRNVNLIILSPILKKDFDKVHSFKKLYFLSNSTEDPFENGDFEKYIYQKKFDKINVLYLSNMMKEKGYFHVLKLALECKDESVIFHFAGSWMNNKDKHEYYSFIKENRLERKVIFHGFVDGDAKDKLFKMCHVFVFPTRYPNEAFPLSIIESFSYGLPVLSTNEGAIENMIHDDVGRVIYQMQELSPRLNDIKYTMLNETSSRLCRNHYLNNFTMDLFEKGLINILTNKNKSS